MVKSYNVLLDRNIIYKELYWKLKPTDSPAPRFYGLPKIHKPEIPIRPIVSYTGTPLYKLSRYIASILSTLPNQGMGILRIRKSFLNILSCGTENLCYFSIFAILDKNLTNSFIYADIALFSNSLRPYAHVYPFRFGKYDSPSLNGQNKVKHVLVCKLRTLGDKESTITIIGTV